MIFKIIIFKSSLINPLQNTDINGFKLTISSIACVQFKVDDDILIFQQQASENLSLSNSLNDQSLETDDLSNALPSKIIRNAQLLNYCFIESFLDNKDLMSNFNIILLVKNIDLDSYLKQANPKDSSSVFQYYCLTMSDVLLTWSLQIHYVVYESLIKPGLLAKSKLNKCLIKNNLKPNEENNANFKLNVLIESDVLINFLFDYSQDSTKNDGHIESKHF